MTLPISRTLALLLLSAFVLQGSVRTMVWIDFILERQELARTVCEQRDVPGNCCQASCVLKKSLDETTPDHTHFPSAWLESMKECIADIPEVEDYFAFADEENAVMNPFELKLKDLISTSVLLRPPGIRA